MTVMVTGGAGYIGSHAVQRLVRDGLRVVVVDNLFRGHAAAIDLLRAGAGDRLTFVPADVGDRDLMLELMRKHRVETVMHFAALAYVGESVQQPLRYYRANTAGTLGLLEAVQGSWGSGGGYAGVGKFVFSSTCASYGEPNPENIPIPETCPQQPINPYGWSKLFCERMLRDFAAMARVEKRAFAWAAPRYFNVAGCDRSGLLGEHHEPETHLLPVCLQVCLGQREALTIHGIDYPTPDGTCIRDYVHVEDLVDAHVQVMKALRPGDERIYNLGIGMGLSVRQIVESVKRVTGIDFPVKAGARRPGDPPELFANPGRIASELGWKAKITDPDEIVRSAWTWFRANPRGYGSKPGGEKGGGS